ncbi:Hypothetical predicted protein, partial [Pelobates cultripes]
ISVNKKKENLTKRKKQALKSLKDNRELVIRQADKGGSIVVLNRDDYMKESQRILGDSNTYKILKSNPTCNFKKKLYEILDEGFKKGIIDKDEFDYLFISSPKTAVFYYLPKVHKSLISPPGRPIISGIGSMTSNISQYIDFFLQKYVTQTRS